jgi:hypothetical protein
VDKRIDAKRVVSPDGEIVGTAGQRLETDSGEVMLVERVEHLGGGRIVVPARELRERGEEIVTPYGRLSVREAPPYSPNVPLEAYVRFWRRLDGSNLNESESAFLTPGSGQVPGPSSNLPDEEIAALVELRLREAGSSGVEHHLIEVTAKNGTVLLEGRQNDTAARLAAAQTAASVPGVREVVNMIVIRADV